MRDLFDEMERFHDDMERYFNKALRGYERPVIEAKGQKGVPMLYRTPRTSLHETDKSVIAELEMPGVSKDKIEVNVTEKEIEVKAEEKFEEKKEDKKKGVYTYQSRCQNFYRRIPLPTNIESNKAEAEYKDGVLKIKIPKKKEIEAKKKTLLIK